MKTFNFQHIALFFGGLCMIVLPFIFILDEEKSINYDNNNCFGQDSAPKDIFNKIMKGRTGASFEVIYNKSARLDSFRRKSITILRYGILTNSSQEVYANEKFLFSQARDNRKTIQCNTLINIDLIKNTITYIYECVNNQLINDDIIDEFNKGFPKTYSSFCRKAEKVDYQKYLVIETGVLNNFEYINKIINIIYSNNKKSIEYIFDMQKLPYLK